MGSFKNWKSLNVLFSNQDYQAISNSVQSASPDLIGFQELKQRSAVALVNILETEYPYHTLTSLGSRLAVGLLSRFPIETAKPIPLAPMDMALHAIININGQRVRVFAVHLSPNEFFDKPVNQLLPQIIERYGRRAAEVTRLHTEIAHLKEPVLLMCDCNLTDTSQTYARLDEILDDSFREVGWGFGHTFHPPIAPIPIQRIDYVWRSNDFVGAIPAEFVRTFSWFGLAQMLAAALIFLLLALIAFHQGLRRYESGSAIQIQV